MITCGWPCTSKKEWRHLLLYENVRALRPGCALNTRLFPSSIFSWIRSRGAQSCFFAHKIPSIFANKFLNSYSQKVAVAKPKTRVVIRSPALSSCSCHPETSKPFFPLTEEMNRATFGRSAPGRGLFCRSATRPTLAAQNCGYTFSGTALARRKAPEHCQSRHRGWCCRRCTRRCGWGRLCAGGRQGCG